jgi:hypothetical protein
MNTALRNRGVCFGFEIRSSLPFRFLRAGHGEPVEVSTEEEITPFPEETLVVEWKPREGRPFHGRVYQDEGGRYRVWTSDAGWFLVDPAERSIVAQEGIDDLRREVRLLTTPLLLLMVEQGDLPLHASAVEINGRAFLFGAPSRFGKTTMAAGFHAAGQRVLAEDVACVRFNDEPMVIPGPALLRLRRDVAEQLELGGVDQLGEDPDRLFLALAGERAGDAQALPLGGLILLRGDSPETRLARVTGPDLLRDLWALGFKLPTDADFHRCFDGLARLSGETNTWNLSFPRDLSRLSATVETLIAELGR